MDCSSSSIADDTREEKKLGSKVSSEEDREEGEEESVSQLRESFIAERDQKVTYTFLLQVGLASPLLTKYYIADVLISCNTYVP